VVGRDSLSAEAPVERRRIPGAPPKGLSVPPVIRIGSVFLNSIALSFLLGSSGLRAGDLQPLENLTPAILNYTEGDDFTPFAAATASLIGSDAEQRIAAEATLLDLLDSPGATQAARVELLRILERVAGPASVGPVARLLTDPVLSHSARRVLQNLDSPDVDTVLLAALRETGGDLRIGMIGSLGRRRAPAAVNPLQSLAASDDLPTARASLRALGAIGTQSAFVALDRVVVPDELVMARFDAQLQAAETLRRKGDRVEAAVIARRMTEDDHPIPIRLGAYLLLSRAESSESASVAIEMLESGTPELVAGGLHLVANARPAEATRSLAALLEQPDIPRIPLIQALVERDDIAARAAILVQANSEEPAVRAAAVRALGSLGSVDELDMLIARLQAGRDEARAAADALSLLPEIEVDIELLRIYRTFEDPPAADLAGILARRNNRAAIPFMLEAALLENDVGRKSIRALAGLAKPSDVPELIALLDLVPPGYRRGIEQAAISAIRRSNLNPPPLTSILGAMSGASPENRDSLLRIAGAAGGSAAVATLARVYTDGGPKDRRRVEAILMANPKAEYLDLVYLVVAETADATVRRRLIANSMNLISEWRWRKADQQTEVLIALAPLARTVEEKALILDVAAEVATEGSLSVVEDFAEVPELTTEAGLAADRITSILKEAENP
jgi:HEAT repeat protein